MKHISRLALCFLVTTLSACSGPDYSDIPSPAEARDPLRPNILLIVADDLGYSDLGAFGGDADTPHLDRLALEGIRLTNFHAAPSCSPSRAQLLSGADNHLVGLGNMKEMLPLYPYQIGKPGYEGHLNHQAFTISSILQRLGYRTYMAGKWHMGSEPDLIPHARGFDRSFVLATPGGSSHYEADSGLEEFPIDFMEDTHSVPWPNGKYSSDHYTDKLLEYLEDDPDQSRPFFAYLAYTVPHAPLHAPEETINKYRGKFDDGYDAAKTRRLAKMHKLGIIANPNVAISPHPDLVNWDSLSQQQKQVQSRLMEVYTAMIDNMDVNVGRVISYLEETGKLENTLIIFLSDNGAYDKDLSSSPIWKPKFDTSDNSLKNIGRPGSWTGMGPGWAHAVTVPNRLAKQFTSAGGIRVPAFVWLPEYNSNGRISNAFVHIRDIAPTIIDYADIDLPNDLFRQRNAHPWTGNSLLPLLNNKTDRIHTEETAFGWEHRERFALIKGNWKLLKLPKPYGTGNWELFNLAQDPGETLDLSRSHPKKLSELLVAWESFIKDNNVVLR